MNNSESCYFPSGTIFKSSIYDDSPYRYSVVRSYDREDENGNITVVMLILSQEIGDDGKAIEHQTEWSLASHHIERGIGNRQIISDRNIGIHKSLGYRYRKSIERHFNRLIENGEAPFQFQDMQIRDPYFRWDRIS